MMLFSFHMHIAYVGGDDNFAHGNGGQQVKFDEDKYDFNAMPRKYIGLDPRTGKYEYGPLDQWNLGLKTYESINPQPNLDTDSFQRVENFVDPAWVENFNNAMGTAPDPQLYKVHLYNHVWPGVKEKWLEMFGRKDKCYLKIDAEHNKNYKSKHASNPCPAKQTLQDCKGIKYCEWNNIIDVEPIPAGWNYREAQVDFQKEWFQATQGFGKKMGWYRHEPRSDLTEAKKAGRPGAMGIHVDTALQEAMGLYEENFGKYGKVSEQVPSFLQNEKKRYYGQAINIWFPLSTEDLRTAPLGLVTNDKEHMIVNTVTQKEQAVTWYTAKVPHAMLNAVYPREDGKVTGLTRTSADLRFQRVFSRKPSVEFLVQYDVADPQEAHSRHYSYVAEKKSRPVTPH